MEKKGHAPTNQNCPLCKEKGYIFPLQKEGDLWWCKKHHAYDQSGRQVFPGLSDQNEGMSDEPL